jgi:hypothetical protein
MERPLSKGRTWAEIFKFAVQDALGHFAAGGMEGEGPAGAIGGEKLGLEFVAAADPGVAAAGFRRS